MKVLAIDTSQKVCSVAVVEDGTTLKEMHSISEKEHSQTLMPMIKEVLDSLKMSLDNIDLLACCKGPGSFTGIRVGLATANAFSDAKNTPIVGINSLEALAYCAIMQKGRKDAKIMTMLDAKNDNAYFAVYKVHNGNVSIYKNPDVINISNMIEYINFREPVYIIGDIDMEKLTPFLNAKKDKESAQGKDVCQYEYIEINTVLAEAIGLAAFTKFKMGRFGFSESISPMYLRRPQAQRKKEGEEEAIYILEMTSVDVEFIKENYDSFTSSWDLKTFEEDSQNSKYLVAKQDNKIVGFIGIRTIFDDVDIMNIVVRTDKRGIGIASNMLSYIIRKNENKKINLEVNENNISAIKLYQKFGFKVEGMRKKYYNKKEDAILMTLNLE